ncbi:MAG: hypothetical protein SGPRY_000688 [Prymnesium sp.]
MLPLEEADEEADSEDEADPLGLLEKVRVFGSKSKHSRLNPMVGASALVGVRQFYQIVASESEPSRGKGKAVLEQTAKRAEVVRLLDAISFHQALVFCNQHEQAEELSRMLLENGLPTAFISGALSQEERCSLMLQMRRFDLRVLITTDLLSRGVDFGRLTLVIHMSLPRELSTYLHRVGRTGRFGTVGVSVLLLSENDVPRAEELLQSMRATPAPRGAQMRPCRTETLRSRTIEEE